MNRKSNILYHIEAPGISNKNHCGIRFVYYSFVIILFYCLSCSKVASQVPFTSRETGSEFNRGMELFNKEKYPAAIRLFDSFVRNGDRSNLILVADAEYFSASSALKLFNPDAEYRMMMFIYSHPESPRINDARLELGNYFYQNKNYRKAVTYYETVNRQELKSACPFWRRV